ncbi:MAG: YkgJ family cysteine cluster protein [Nitrosopumilus sp.]|nr:YkgJ family cysteine cluster protein [Nitrosopumilus sp.]MDA7953045.1 YkgJ family cysteine cluster protein [Nitrosopumilus sp.]MDA7958303.1 YkgJ family cysteine cluster protein [Nitrosopumilus sp.]MDA7959990.1 YkgJ family cysteine cluster protein [Nitrosopumilus sp.]
MSGIEESLDQLGRDWDIDPVLRGFMLGRVTDVSDRQVRVGRVVFHIPYLRGHDRHVLWGCRWPDCDNCCKKQGRLPLTSSDMITIGSGLKYKSRSEFLRSEALIATHAEPGPGSGSVVMTTVNLKRMEGETEADDGTRVPCRFLGGDGACTLHPGRPGVCYMYPFSAWIESEGGMARVHASYQFDGCCPGFYLDRGTDPMRDVLAEYSGIIHGYVMDAERTAREGLSSVSIA